MVDVRGNLKIFVALEGNPNFFLLKNEGEHEKVWGK